MLYEKHKYIGCLGLISLIGLKGFTSGNHIWFIFLLNFLWFTFFYENSIVYKQR